MHNAEVAKISRDYLPLQEFASVVWKGRFGGEAGEAGFSLWQLAALVVFGFHTVLVLAETVHLLSPLRTTAKREQNEKEQRIEARRSLAFIQHDI